VEETLKFCFYQEQEQCEIFEGNISLCVSADLCEIHMWWKK